MIALTWWTQLWEPYSSTKLFCLLDQVPVNWFWDYCILLTRLFCLRFPLLLILEDVFSLCVCLSRCAARLHPHSQTDINTRERERERRVGRLVNCSQCDGWHHEPSLFPVAPVMLWSPVWCCSQVHSSVVSRYVKNAGCASLLSGQRVFTHLSLWL